MKHKYSLITAALILAAAALPSCSSTGPEKPSAVSETEQTAADPAVHADTEPFEAEGIHFSAKSGFYDKDISLTLTAPDGMKIFYTTDGSIPTLQSTEYTAPVIITDRSSEADRLASHEDIAQPSDESEDWIPGKPVDKATVVRAIAAGDNGEQTGVVSCTYFIGFDQKADYYKDTTVISMMTDEADLFDYDKGIYVIGRCYDEWQKGPDYVPDTPYYFLPGNYTQKGRDWERQATLQFFRSGEAELTQDVGIRIHGGATRSYPQKSFNIYARSDYGLPKLDYDLFKGNVKSESDGDPITEFDTFMIRNGGNDAMYTRFRDKLAQSLVSGHGFLTQGMEPCILFIDGEYWGQYEMTEKIDDAYVSSHCGIPESDVCIIKKEELDEGSEETFNEWKELREWLKTADLSDSAEYDKLCGLVDMQSFMEYVSAEIYIDNENWGASNMAMWKAQTVSDENPFADGKWRFIMFDVDYSSGIYGEALPRNDSFETLLESDCFLADLLRAALGNEGFRKEFEETFRHIAENDFSAVRVDTEIARLSKEYKDMAIDTIARFWSGYIPEAEAEEWYEDCVGMMKDFYDGRSKYILEYLEKHISEAP